MKNLSLAIVQKSSMLNCFCFQTSVSHLFESHAGNELSQEMSFLGWLESFERKGGAINRAALVQFCRAVMKIHQSRQNVWNVYKSIHCVRISEAWSKKNK